MLFAAAFLSLALPAFAADSPSLMVPAGSGMASLNNVIAMTNNQKLWGLQGDITFNYGSSQIRPEMQEPLNQAAEKIMEFEKSLINGIRDWHIKITGFTDKFGSESSNQILSEKRAKSIENYLVGRGVKENSLYSTGVGEKFADQKCASQKRCAADRKVEFELVMEPNQNGSVGLGVLANNPIGPAVAPARQETIKTAQSSASSGKYDYDCAKMGEQIKSHEGVRERVYLDSVGLLTVGIGYNVNEWEWFKNIDFQDGNGVVLDSQRKREYFDSLKNYMRDNPQQCNIARRSCENNTIGRDLVLPDGTSAWDIKITKNSLDNYLCQRLDTVYSTLSKSISCFRDFPEGPKHALLDMGYAKGESGLLRGWPKLIEAVRNLDWDTAAVESQTDSSNNNIMKMNKMYKDLFLEGNNHQTSCGV